MSPYQIILGTGKAGVETALFLQDAETLIAEGKTSSALHRLARVMVSAGLSDGPWEAGRLSGSIDLYGGSIFRLAATDLMESDAGFATRLFTPSPYGTVCPLVAAVVAAERARRKAHQIARSGMALS
jgi:hypothetical protein